MDACQGRGLGRRLARELGLRARRAGLDRLRATVELGNEPAFALLRRLGTIEETRLDGEVVEVLVAL